MRHPDRRSHTLAVLASLLVTVLWSSSWILIRIGLDDETLPPLTFAGLRYGLASLVLIGWMARPTAARPIMARPTRTDLLWFGVLGLGFYSITQGAQFVAIDNQPAATTSLVLSMTPLLVAAFAATSIGERASGRQFAGAGMVAGGALLYFSGDLSASVLGMTAAAVALIANASSSLLGRHVNHRRETPALVVTAISMSVGAVVLLGAGIGIEGWPSVSARAMLIIAWLAVVNTAVAFTLWNVSLRHLSAIESAGINNLMLLQIAALAWVFLDESPGPLGLVGIAVVSLGVFLTQSGTGRRG